MANLTQEQIMLIKWMKTGRTFQVCSDYCPTQGEVQPKSRLPIQVHQKTIHKLFKEGLIEFTSHKYFGLRWDVFSLTSKGKAFL
ncbi:hypothetical protein QYV87_004673 [Vibrio parahaemolyticus]|nr:hypothetical protein [Vibrio parahaemolyticus]ELA8837660.1 hypothetical protein [Vibrio parahaemolyticus]